MAVRPLTKQRGRSTALTVSRKEMLVSGSDAAFREMVHDLLAFGHCMDACRDAFAALMGISGVQYEILLVARKFSVGIDREVCGISVGEVAARLRRTGAFITIEAGRLVERSLIEKRDDPRDARRVLLVLTRAGEMLIEGVAPFQRQVNDVLFACLDAQRFKTLRVLMSELVQCGDRAAALSAFLLRSTPEKIA